MNNIAEIRDGEIVQPRSVEIAKRGVTTSQDFAELMSAMMSDIIEGKITPGVGNAAVNAGGKLLKVVEMQARYGTPSGGEQRSLQLVAPHKNNA